MTNRARVKRRPRRPVLHPVPKSGQVYEWEGNDHLFLILSADTSDREIWMCQALNLHRGHEEVIGIRKHDKHNGWRQIVLNAPF